MKSILIFLLLISCSKKEVLVSKREMFDKAMASGEKFELVIPSNINAGIHCTDYGEGCLGGHTVRVGRLEMIVVEFDSEANAIKSARSIKGMYAKNWVFDDTANEPLLKIFAEKTYDAKVPE